MRVLSVDLASASYRDIGVALLVGGPRVLSIMVRLEEVGLVGRPNAAELAHFLDEFASNAGAGIIAIDGPQGWKDPDNGQHIAGWPKLDCTHRARLASPAHASLGTMLALSPSPSMSSTNWLHADGPG